MAAPPPPVEGVLLYYHYYHTSQPQDQPEVVEWYTALCTEQGLVGRVRVARDGLNATLGGDLEALRAHSAAVAARFGEGIDFKLAESSRKNDASASEAGFTTLRVVAVKVRRPAPPLVWPAAEPPHTLGLLLNGTVRRPCRRWCRWGWTGPPWARAAGMSTPPPSTPCWRRAAPARSWSTAATSTRPASGTL